MRSGASPGRRPRSSLPGLSAGVSGVIDQITGDRGGGVNLMLASSPKWFSSSPIMRVHDAAGSIDAGKAMWQLAHSCTVSGSVTGG